VNGGKEMGNEPLISRKMRIIVCLVVVAATIFCAYMAVIMSLKP